MMGSEGRNGEPESASNGEWRDFQAEYGRAILNAQSLESSLATCLSFFEARKKAVLRRPTPDQIDELIDEIDGNPLGAILARLREFHVLEADAADLFEKANQNRRTLVHHFVIRFWESRNDQAFIDSLHSQVLELVGPINDALPIARQLVEVEIARMQEEIASRRANPNTRVD